MAQTVLSSIPQSFVAGDTVSWSVSLADYPANQGWQLKYKFINAGGGYQITAATSGADFIATIPAAASAAYTAGQYTWQAWVEKSGERYTTGTGNITIKPDLAAASAGLDLRSSARKALDAIDAWISTRDMAVAEYEIAGRRMKYISITELIKLRSQLRAEVNREAAANKLSNGLSSRPRTYVRF